MKGGVMLRQDCIKETLALEPSMQRLLQRANAGTAWGCLSPQIAWKHPLLAIVGSICCLSLALNVVLLTRGFPESSRVARDEVLTAACDCSTGSSAANGSAQSAGAHASIVAPYVDLWQVGMRWLAMDAVNDRQLAENTEQGKSSSDSSQSSSHGNHGHAHDAMLFMFNAIIIGTIVLHLTTLPKLHGVQQTVALFVLGIIYSLVQEGLHLHKKLGVLGRSYSMWMDIDPHLILFTMLPALLAGDAMAIDTSVVKRVAQQCIYLAGPGVLACSFLTALFLKYYMDWSFELSLTMGAILAATDPVAVVSLLKQLGAPATLTVQIAGESLLNDGTAIVLYTLAYEMLQGETFTFGQILIFVVRKAICACGLGWIIGWIFVMWISAAGDRFQHHSGTIQICLTLCCAYWSFIIAEGVLDMSGVLSTVSASLVLADRMWPNLVDKESMHNVWHIFEFLGNTMIFFLAGALTGNCMIHIPWEDYLHLLVMYMVITVIRGAFIFASRPLLMWLSADRKPVSRAEAVIMTWGGLRGAVGLALAIQVSVDRADGNVSEMNGRRVLFFTGGIASLTLIINATTCPSLVKALGIVNSDSTRNRIVLGLLEQLGSQADDMKTSEAVHDVITHMLRDIRHHIVGDPKDSSQNSELGSASVSKIFEGNMKGLSTKGSTDTEMSDGGIFGSEAITVNKYHFTSEARTAITGYLAEKHRAVQEGKALLETLDSAKQIYMEVPRYLLQELDVPPLLELKELDEMRDAVGTCYCDPSMVRAINEAFLHLVRSNYWNQIEAGEVIDCSNHPDILFGSIAYGLQHAESGLNDFELIVDQLGLEDVFESMKSHSRGSGLFRFSTRASAEVFEKANTFFGKAAKVTQVMSGGALQTRSSVGEALPSSSPLSVLVKSTCFNLLMMLAIFLNVVYIFVEEQHLKESEGEDKYFNVRVAVEISFNVVFTVEFILKFAALRSAYWKSAWNVFDFALVIFGLVGIFMEFVAHTEGDVSSTDARAIRLNRIFRVMKLMRVFRLVKFIQVLRMKLKGIDISLNQAMSLRTITVLMAFVQAHIDSQERFLHFFGHARCLRACEQARCMFESQTAVFRALTLAAKEVKKVDVGVLGQMNTLRQSGRITDRLIHSLHAAGGADVINAREEEVLMHPLYDHRRKWQSQMHQCYMGFLNTMDVRPHIRLSGVDDFISPRSSESDASRSANRSLVNKRLIDSRITFVDSYGAESDASKSNVSANSQSLRPKCEVPSRKLCAARNLRMSECDAEMEDVNSPNGHSPVRGHLSFAGSFSNVDFDDEPRPPHVLPPMLPVHPSPPEKKPELSEAECASQAPPAPQTSPAMLKMDNDSEEESV